MSAFEDVCAAVEAAMAETDTPGVAVSVLTGGVEQAAGFGVTSVENPLEVTPDTLFQIGSITKTFTGTAAMILVERGELDLDAPLRTYLPELRLLDEDAAARATMRHLLTHTGGWVGDYFDDLGPGDEALARIVESLAELPQLTPLGAVWSYNNAGFYIAGRVIELIAAKPYEQVVQELLLEPLGLEHTFFFTDDVMTRRFVVGHLRNENGPPTVARPWSIGRAHHPAGGLTSTVRDLLRYARFQMSDGEGIVARDTLDEMQRVQVHAGSVFEDVGLTWSLATRNGRRTAGHGGGTSGQIALFTFLPDEGAALAVLTNHQRGGEVTLAAVNAFGLGREAHTPMEVDAEEYLGTYTSALQDVELRRENGALMLITMPKGGFPKKDSPPLPAPPPMPVAFHERDRLFVPEGPLTGLEAEFLRAPDGSIAWFRVGGRVMKRGGSWR
jgi:CubicO group peptidase (beta-lactamase class C family)